MKQVILLSSHIFNEFIISQYNRLREAVKDDIDLFLFPQYDYYWNIEYDVYFNGEWNILFDAVKFIDSDFISSHLDRYPHFNNLDNIGCTLRFRPFFNIYSIPEYLADKFGNISKFIVSLSNTFYKKSLKKEHAITSYFVLDHSLFSYLLF